MLYEKIKLLIHRVIWLILLLLGIIIPLVLTADSSNQVEVRYFFIADVFILSFFIRSLLLSCKVYDYKGKEIIVYAGWFHHYIKVDEKILDEIDMIMTYTPISLSCTLEDGTTVAANITLTNRISLKINNQLYTNIK